MTQIEDGSSRVVYYALKQRSSDRGATARIRAGLTQQAEHRAYADILPLVDTGVSDREKTTHLRVAALIAEHPDIPQATAENRLPLGATFRQLSTALARIRGAERPTAIDPGSPDSIAVRLSQLPEQDLEAAVLTVHRILSIADDFKVPIDYYALMRTFLRWGNGVSERSMHVRRQPLRDYYSYSPTQTIEKDA